MDRLSGTAKWARVAHCHPLATDLAVAAVLCAATLLGANPGPHGGSLSGTAILAAVTAYGASLCRRRWPVPTLAATAAAAAAYTTLSGSHGWVVTAPMIVLYHMADTTSDRRRLLVSGALAALVLAGTPPLFTDTAWLGAESFAVTATCGLAIAAGDASRNRRAYVAEVEEQARRAEQDREQETRRRITDERLRIARDLHDSMGHHIALINAQAGMGAHLFDARPTAARQALTNIMHASRGALDDLRETIGLLRQPGEPAGQPESTAGLTGITTLVASFTSSGMRIDHEVDGVVRPLPPATERAAYRVVQESLTNVRKHAGNMATRVRLSFKPSELHILVENDWNGAPAAHADTHASVSNNDSGHGIVGMRERVSTVGGSLDAGLRSAGGFQVHAILPLPEGDCP